MNREDICKLEKADKELQELIRTCAEANNLCTEEIEPIYDGICSAEAYLSSNTKIMWILKEPYDDFDDDGNPIGGGWSLTQGVINNIDWLTKNRNGWRNRLIYTSFAVLTGKQYSSIPYYTDQNSIAKDFQQCAYINISKMPAFTSTDNGALWNKYQIWKDVILKQIEVYDPEVIICGGTFDIVKGDLFIDESNLFGEYADKTIKAYTTEDRLVIRAWHPSYRYIQEESYVNSILQAVQDWKSQEDKSNPIAKYEFIKKLADFFSQQRIVLSSSALAQILNMNGFRTAYGAEYSGGRGTYKLVSSAWGYYDGHNDEETKKNIEYFFRMPNGDTAF